MQHADILNQPLPAALRATITTPDGTGPLTTRGEFADAMLSAAQEPGALVHMPLFRNDDGTLQHGSIPAALFPLWLVLLPALAKPNPLTLERAMQTIAHVFYGAEGQLITAAEKLPDTLATFADRAHKARRDGKPLPRLEDIAGDNLLPALQATALLAQEADAIRSKAHMRFLAKLIAAEAATSRENYEFATRCGPLSPAEFVLIEWLNLAVAMYDRLLLQPDSGLTTSDYTPGRDRNTARRHKWLLQAALKTAVPPDLHAPTLAAVRVGLEEHMTAMHEFAEYAPQ